MKHGGDLSDLRLKLGQDCPIIDLSTGINPHHYPHSPQSSESLNALPSASDLKKLNTVATAYYRVHKTWDYIALPGSQIVLSLLPNILKKNENIKIGIISPTYNEYEHSWQSNGVSPISISTFEHACETSFDVIYLCNPNNPDGRLTQASTIIDKAEQYPETMFIIDEAFMDCSPQESILLKQMLENIIVIRSFGKFFGLAGLRLGWVFATAKIIHKFRSMVGPWAVNTPALHIAAAAYKDQKWQKQQLASLNEMQKNMQHLFQKRKIDIVGQTPLYTLIQLNDALTLHESLANQGIWTRIFEYNPHWMRLGVPKNENDFLKFKEALTANA